MNITPIDPGPVFGAWNQQMQQQNKETETPPEPIVEPVVEPVIEPDAGPDLSTLEAKITELTALVAERDATIADLGAQLVASKAANYDLLMATPATGVVTEPNPADDDTDPDITPADLFGED